MRQTQFILLVVALAAASLTFYHCSLPAGVFISSTELGAEKAYRISTTSTFALVNSSKILNKGPRRVLILSGGRSGSTWLLHMMSQSPNTVKVFEPERSLKVQDGSLLHSWDDKNIPILNEMMQELFNCKEYVFQKIARQSACKTENHIVVKTILIRGDHLGQWLIEKRDIKVILLVRDPRGRYNSLKGYGSKVAFDRLISSCPIFERDLELQEKLGEEKIKLIRYEDLVADPVERIQSLYEFIGAPFTEEIEENVRIHSGKLDDPSKTSNVVGYNQKHSIVRDSSFQQDHWRKELSFEEIRKVEEGCGSLMKKLNYSFFQDESGQPLQSYIVNSTDFLIT